VHRFFVPDVNFQNQVVSIVGEEFKHLAGVLRLRPGDRVGLFDGAGREYLGVIESLEKDRAAVALQEELAADKESPLNLFLVQGIPKGDKMELIIQKATELGVKGIVPLETGRTVVRLEGKKREERRERWQKVAVEAAKQCGRTVVPQVQLPQGLAEFLRSLPGDRVLLIPWEEGGQPLKSLLNGPEFLTQLNIPIYILIGPEGGWEREEVALAEEYGAKAVTLGPRILRTETAGLAAISAIMYQWGDLGG